MSFSVGLGIITPRYPIESRLGFGSRESLSSKVRFARIARFTTESNKTVTVIGRHVYHERTAGVTSNFPVTLGTQTIE